MAGAHPEHEDFPWTIAVVDHPPRKDTPAYGRSRRLMIKLVGTMPDWVLAGDAYEDHQIDRLRQYAERVVAAFPETLPGYTALGYKDADHLLTTPITTATQVSAWTDSIFNASLPLPRTAHTGVLPAGAGYHHYPKPIVDIDHFRFDDFQLFVTDPQGFPAVVVPVARRGSGDGRVRLIAAHPGSRYVRRLVEADAVRHVDGLAELVVSGGESQVRTALLTDDAPDVLPDSDPLAREAFAAQPQLHRRSRATRPKSPAIGP